MAKRRHKHDVGIVGIDHHLSDRPRIAQPDVLPGLSAVERLVNAIAVRDVSTNAGLACAYIHNVRIGRRHRKASD